MKQSFNDIKKKINNSIINSLLQNHLQSFDSESQPENLDLFEAKYQKVEKSNLDIKGDFGDIGVYEEIETGKKFIAKTIDLSKAQNFVDKLKPEDKVNLSSTLFGDKPNYDMLDNNLLKQLATYGKKGERLVILYESAGKLLSSYISLDDLLYNAIESLVMVDDPDVQ